MSEAFSIPYRQLEAARIDSRSFQEVSPEYALGVMILQYTRELDDGWRSQAACDGEGVDSEIFFPERRGDNGKIKEAKKICASCPVQQECLDYALENNEDLGVWGGMSRNQRKKLKRAQKLNEKIS